MITEEQVIRFFDEANPVPSVESLDVESLGAARHLAALSQRSSEMVQLETKTTDPRRGTKPPAWLIAVATAVLVIAVGVLLVLVDNEPEVATPDPETVIDQFFAASDYESLAATMTAEGIAGYRGVWGYTLNPDGIADEMAAKAVLGVALSAESCHEVGESVVRCQVVYEDNLTEPLGEEPVVREATFNMDDGLISVYPNLTNRNLFSLGSGAGDAALRQEFGVLCPASGALQPECATFIMDNLDVLNRNG